MKNKTKFKEFMAGLGEVFDKEISPMVTKIYWRVLEPFSDSQCEKAFNQIIASCKFWPKPSEFIEIIKGSEEDRATLAWLELDKAVRRIGNMVSVQFDDLVIHSTVEALGGWEALGNATESEWKWLRKDFISMYSRMAKKNIHPERLIGKVERENLAMGYEDFIPKTFKIGVPERLRLAEVKP